MIENVVYFRGQPIRIVEDDGLVWFIVADVCKVLGFQHNNTTTMLSRLPQDCHRKYAIGKFRTKTNAINRNGLVMLTMRSRASRARELQAWIVSNNLPIGSVKPVLSEPMLEEKEAALAIRLEDRRAKDNLIVKLKRIRDLSDQFINALQDF